MEAVAGWRESVSDLRLGLLEGKKFSDCFKSQLVVIETVVGRGTRPDLIEDRKSGGFFRWSLLQKYQE